MLISSRFPYGFCSYVYLITKAMLTLLLVVCTQHAIAEDNSAKSINGISALQQFLAGTKTLRAEFTQSVRGKSAKKAQISSGNMSFSRPGKFRWQISMPYPQLMVGDGQKFWIYDEELKQVTVRQLGKALGSTPAALLAGKNELGQNFTLKDDGEENGVVWVLAIPKQPDSGFEKVRLGFATQGQELRVMELFDSFGQVTQLHFNHVEKNPKLAPQLFKFQAPAGADIVGE